MCSKHSIYSQYNKTAKGSCNMLSTVPSMKEKGKAKETEEGQKTLGEGCGGLDWGKCLESGTNSRRSAE